MRLKTNIFLFFLFSLITYFVLTAFVNKTSEVNQIDKIQDVLYQLGDEMPLHFIPTNQLDSNRIKAGYNLVTKGFMTPQSKRQSKHFVCTDCHNIQREDPDLTQSNPEARLDYGVKNGLKFLPATTLYGQVNKKSWYNEDYYKKYGELVVSARDTLENAIQLCATVCSQGRALEKDEMEAVMHYFNSIGYTLQDLNLTDSEKTMISNSLASQKDQKKVIELLKSKYLDYSPATFMDPQPIASRSFGKKGNAINGKKIYELSCLTCHKEGGVTNYKLNNEQLTFKHLKYWSKTDKVFSVYDITRKGTYSKNGYKPYMPNYTKERLSDQQLEDLMAYINSMSASFELNPKRAEGRKFLK